MSRISNDTRVRIVTVALGSYVKDVRNGHRNVSMSKKLQENGYSRSGAYRLAKELVDVLVKEKFIRIHRDKTVSWVSERRLLSCSDVPRLLSIVDEALAINSKESVLHKETKCKINEESVKEIPAHTESEYQWGEKPLPEMAWTCSFSW